MAASSPGRDAPLPDDQEVKITRLSVGMWPRRATRGPLFLLVLHSSDKFVLLSEDSFTSLQAQPRRLYNLPSHLHARSPFRTISGTAGNFSVIAMEIDWKDICGLNYYNPLCNEGRVVIEAAKLTKRQFTTMHEAYNFYLRQAITPLAASPQHVNRRAGILRTYASSPDMRHPSVIQGLIAEDTAQRQQERELQQGQGQQHGHQSTQQLSTQHQHQHQFHALCHTSSASHVAQSSSHMLTDLSSSHQQAATPFSTAGPIAEELPQDATDAASRSVAADQPSRHAGIGTTSPPQARHTGQAASSLDADAAALHGPPTAPLYTTVPASAPVTARQPHQHCHFIVEEVPEQSGQATVRMHEHDSAVQSVAGQASSGIETGSSAVQGTAVEWPNVSNQTLPGVEFGYRTITFSFVDPNLPEVLRPAINENERLLKLYESGLPVWAIFLPTYGLYYRPWMRRMTWIIFIAVSVFSMACGFYDLYKNVPHLDKVLRRVLGAMCLPSTAIFQWLENHAQIRLSILLTYLFGESIFVVHLLTWLGRAWDAVGQPMMRVIGPPLVAVGAFVEQWGLATQAILKTMFGPALLHLLHFLHAVGQTLLPIWQAVVWMVTGPAKMCIAACQSVGAAGRGMWQGAQPLRQAASGLVRTASMAAPVTQSSAQNLSQQVQWWWAWMPSDAWELMRSSALKVMRALQTLGKLTAQLGSDINKHRGSLGRRLWRLWRRSKARFQRVFAAIVAWPIALYRMCMHWMANCMRRQPEPAIASEAEHSPRPAPANYDDRPILNGMAVSSLHSHVE